MQAEVREQVRELYEREKRKDSINIRGLSPESLTDSFSNVAKYL